MTFAYIKIITSCTGSLLLEIFLKYFKVKVKILSKRPSSFHECFTVRVLSSVVCEVKVSNFHECHFESEMTVSKFSTFFFQYIRIARVEPFFCIVSPVKTSGVPRFALECRDFVVSMASNSSVCGRVIASTV